MKGFWPKRKNTIVRERVPEITDCPRCKLYKKCKSPNMPPTGEGRKGIFILAEAPGKTEDEQGVQLVGESGLLLRSYLRDFGIDLDKDCVKANAVNCRPPNNEAPTDRQITFCRPSIWAAIKEHKPKVIILLGATAIKSWVAHRWPDGDPGGITKWRGWTIPDQELQAWVCPTFHPAYVLRQSDAVTEVIFKQDLKQALALAKGMFADYSDYKDRIEIEKQPSKIVRYIRSLRERSVGEHITFDYETTGLKPYRNPHQIVSCALCADGDVSFAFPTSDKEVKRELNRFLIDEHIGKVAAHCQFENIWTRALWKIGIQNWQWDTVVGAHVLDNRKYITGTKFQAFVRYGILGYDTSANRWIKTDPDSPAWAMNNILDAPIDEILLYNGIDSLVEEWIYEDQREELGLEA